MNNPIYDHNNTAALIIDVQYIDPMPVEEAREFLENLGQSIEDLRDRNIPVIWVTIDQRLDPRLVAPVDDADTPAKPRDIDVLEKEMGFFGLASESPEHREAFTDFIKKYGPRTNEAISIKSVKSALVEAEDIGENNAYRSILEEEAFKSAEEALKPEASLARHLRIMGTENTIIMGTMSSHCVSETAVSAALKGFNPVVLQDRVVSWMGKESEVNPRTSSTFWRETAESGTHETKITTKLQEIINDPVRNFSVAEQAHIHEQVKLSNFSDALRFIPISVEKRPHMNDAPEAVIQKNYSRWKQIL